jgi:hypothetical protein
VAGKTVLYAPVPKAKPPKRAEPAKGEQDGT